MHVAGIVVAVVAVAVVAVVDVVETADLVQELLTITCYLVICGDV